MRIIIENLEILILNDSEVLTKRNHIDEINSILQLSLKKCREYIHHPNEQLQAQCFDIFENEWNQYNQISQFYIDNLAKNPYILLPINLSDEIAGNTINLLILL